MRSECSKQSSNMQKKKKKEQLVYGVFSQRREAFQLRHLRAEQVLSRASPLTAPGSRAAASEATHQQQGAEILQIKDKAVAKAYR